MKYAFMLVELMAYPLSVVCRVLNVTQSGFHAWRNREPSSRERERDRLRGDIRKVFDVHRGRYGAPRLYRVLRARHGYTGMESFWHSLKVEETHGQDFATHAEAKHCVFDYIKGWYTPRGCIPARATNRRINSNANATPKGPTPPTTTYPPFQATTDNPLG